MGERWRKLVFLLQRRQMDRDLAEEMRQHAALKTQKNIAAGMTPAEADLAAKRQLGNLTRQHEESRQSWGFPLLENIGQDIQYGLRGLRKAPGFTLVATLTLALGIGASTAIFSIVNAVVLRPLPYKDSSRMVEVWTVGAAFPEFRMGQSVPNIKDIKALVHSFTATTVYELARKNLTGSGEPEQLSAAAVAFDFFGFFSVHPAQGREFVAADEQRKSGDVVLLSDGLWKQRFGGDAKVVGSRILLEQKPYTVVGVMPAGFSYPDKTDVWVPLVIDAKTQEDRTHWSYYLLAKLRPGVSPQSAQSEVDGIAAAIAQQHPAEASGLRFPIETLQETTLGNQKAELLSLAAAVGFLLLIACANVSNLVLARGFKRQREIAVRAALGASRTRIVRQLLVESLLLALAGGLAGSLMAVWGVDAFRVVAPAGFPRLEELRVEPATALIAFAITAFTGILCGLAPAFSASRANLNFALKEKIATAIPQRFSLRGVLVVTEVALALILLTGSALMVQSMVRLLSVDTGLRTQHIVTASLGLPKVRYSNDDAYHLFDQRLLEALQAEPLFSGVALSDNTVMRGGVSVMAMDRKDLADLGLNEERIDLQYRLVSPGFFETLGIRLVRGRFFDSHDAQGAPPVIIMNDSMARHFFPGQDPIGKIFKLGNEPADQLQVVGVVQDTIDSNLQSSRRLQIYFPLLQSPSNGMNHLGILVHTSADSASSVAALRRAVAAVDKDQPLTRVQSIDEAIAESVAEPRFRTLLLSAFAVAGLTLTLIGIYGVISYSVGQRTQEMGIRMALGAPQSNVLRLILREGLVLAVAGAVCGLVGSFLLMRLLSTQLFSIKPTDPPTFVGAAFLMVVVALAASFIPARRATQVDPMIALRDE
ncbi:MAG TPA: ABC transporter permease [Candidatus Angelobacter sp.]